MDANDTSYMEFLKIYFPNAANSVATLQTTSPQGKTPEEIEKSKAGIEAQINSKLNNSDYVNDYNAYLKIPEGLRTLYSGTRVPSDMLEAARRDEILTLMEWEKHPNLKQVEEVREEVRKDYGIPSGVEIPTAVTSAAALVLFASALKAGYSEEASLTLAQQRQHREGLLEEKAAILADPNLSEAEKKEKLRDWLENKWFKSRKKTHDAIEKDWKGADGKEATQPEKYVVRLLAKFSHGKISKEELMPKLADMIQQINNQERQEQLLAYLKEQRIQVKIGHFNNEARDILANLVLGKIPEAEREQYLARDFRKKRGLKEEMADDKKAASAMEDSKTTQANALPKNAARSAEEQRTTASPTVRRGGIEREA